MPNPSATEARPGLASLPRNVWAVTLTSFLNDISSEMLASPMPLFLADVLGAPTGVIGLIEGVAEATSSLLKMASGWASDRLGRRKWLAVGGYALSTASKTVLLLASSWGWVLGARFGDRAGKGLRTAPRDALVADSTPESVRGLAFGIHRAGDTAGAVVGILVAIAVVWSSPGSSVALVRPVFMTLVLLSLVPAAMAVVGLAAVAREVPIVRRRRAAGDPAVTLDRRFRAFLAIMVLFTLGNSSDAFLILRARQAGLSVLGVLGMMLTFNLVYAVISGPAGALSDRVGRRRLIVAGWLVYAMIYLGFARAETGLQAWALMTVYGVYYATTDGVAKAYVADLVPPEGRGTAYGAFNAAVGLAALPSSLIAGVLWQGAWGWPGLGPSAPFVFGAAMSISACALLAALPPASRPDDRHPASVR
jgi:MFS family permease